jgi:hypothetical protein
MVIQNVRNTPIGPTPPRNDSGFALPDLSGLPTGFNAMPQDKVLNDVINNVLVVYPRLADQPDFLREVSNYARNHSGTVDQIWFLKTAKERGINLFGGGGGGRSAADKANSIRSFSSAIINAAGKFGVDISPEMIAYIAEVADAQNFSLDQLNDVILSQTNWDAVRPGELSANIENINQLSSAYLVDLSSDTVRDYSRRIASGESSLEAIQSLIRQQAKSLNPWMTEFIDRGMTATDVLAGARDRIAKSLGITANEIDFRDDNYMKLATFTDDKGQTRLATSSELTKNIRSDSRWQQTEEASQTATAFARTLAQIFGRSVF